MVESGYKHLSRLREEAKKLMKGRLAEWRKKQTWKE